LHCPHLFKPKLLTRSAFSFRHQSFTKGHQTLNKLFLHISFYHHYTIDLPLFYLASQILSHQLQIADVFLNAKAPSRELPTSGYHFWSCRGTRYSRDTISKFPRNLAVWSCVVFEQSHCSDQLSSEECPISWWTCASLAQASAPYPTQLAPSSVTSSS
jgi:hypothetical protein